MKSQLNTSTQLPSINTSIMRKTIALPLITLLICGCGDSGQDSPSLNALNFNITSTGISSEVSINVNGLTLTSITSDDSFDAATMLATGETYTVSYQSSTNQLCRIDNASGTAIKGTQDISININCLNWTDPADIMDKISNSSEDATNAQVALSEGGDAVIVWQQSNGSNEQIFISELRSGTWTYPASLNDNISPNGEDAHSPQVDINANGDTLIAWIQSDGIVDQIFFSEYRNGTWAHPVDTDDSILPDFQYVYNPSVAISDNGDSLIVWNQSDNSRDQVFLSEYRNGTWTHPVDSSDNISPNGNDVNNPKAYINASGESLIVWQQFDGSNNQIFMSEYRNNSWSHPTSATDNISPDTTSASDPRADINDSGESIIVWRQSDSSNSQIFKSEYRNSVWTHPVDLTDNISPSAQDTFTPEVSLGNNGDAVIVWRQSNVSNDQIFMSEFRNNSWSHPSDLQDNISPNGSNAKLPSLSVNSNGETFITWQQTSGIREQIFRSEFRNSTWSHPDDLSDNFSPNDQDALKPKLSCSSNGQALIVWEQQSGSDLQVFVSEHD